MGRLGTPLGLYVPARALGQECKFLYDTGASCTVLSTQLWDRIPEARRPELESPTLQLTTVGDQSIPSRGTCSVELELDGRPVTCRVQVCDISEEAVLGLDLLSTLKYCWDWDRGVLRKCPIQESPDFRVDACSEEHVIGPCSEEHGNGTSEENVAGSQWSPGAEDAESPSGHDLDQQEMEVLVEPYVGLEGLWPEVGRSQDCEEPWEGLLRSIGRSETPGRPCAQVTPSLEGTPSVDVPEHLQQLYADSAAQLSPEAKSQLASLLEEFHHVFSKDDHDLGRTNLEVHQIPTGSARPIRLPPRRAPMHLRADIEQQVQDMIAQGVVEECSSPWAAPLVVVKKKDGSNRICVDYRALNEVTEKDGHPIPRVADSLDALAGAAVFSTLDMTSGYHQVEVAEEDRDKTAFVTGRGHHLRYVTMPFGLCNAPSTFQRLMERVLQGLVWKTAVVYLDDVVIFSRTPEEHLEHLREVFRRFEAHRLKLKPRKCELFRSQVKYLGHVVSATGVATDPGLIEKVTAWDPPRTQKEVRAFLGLTGYYRSYLPHYGEVAEPLVRLTDAYAEFRWTPACQEAFEELKRRLVTAPILAYPNETDPFILDTDASDVAIGAVLSQRQDGQERVIAYGSKALSKEERNYCVTRRELLAVVHFVEAYRYYLYGRPFLIRTDHSSLRWMLRQKEPKDQLARWIQRLAVFQFVIEHRPGAKHGNADGMSRKCFRGGVCFHPTQVEMESPAPPGTLTSSEELRSEQQDVPEPLRAFIGEYLASDVSATARSVSLPRNQTVLSRDVASPADSGKADKFSGADTHVRVAVLRAKKDMRMRRPARKRSGPRTDPAGPSSPSGPTDTSPDSQALPAGLTLAQVAQQQQDDPDLRYIRGRLEAGLTRPEKQEISPLSPAVKYWCARWNQLEVRDGLLKYRWEPKRMGDPVTWKVIAPKTLHETIMTYVHDLKSAGHLGVARTWEKATRSPFLWSGMRADVSRWVRRCQLCQQRKPPAARKRAKMVTYQVGAPWERIAADVAGPFPLTANGNRYILIVQDYFSKWVEIFPMANQTAETVATLLVDQVFARFGCCREFHSDRGTNFTSLVMREVNRLFGVTKTLTTSHHPRGDGMVERQNRTFEGMLSLWTNTHQDDWDVHIPLLAMAYRSSPHETTGETPNMVNFGREVTLPVDLLLAAPPDEDQEPDVSEYAARLQDRLQTVHAAAREHTTHQMVTQKRHYDANVRLVQYHPGDVVWLHNPTRTKGRSPKLTRPWTGPYVVVQRINDVNFRLQASPRAKSQIVHADRMKPCIGRKATDLGFLEWEPQSTDDHVASGQVERELPHSDGRSSESDDGLEQPDASDVPLSHDADISQPYLGHKAATGVADDDSMSRCNNSAAPQPKPNGTHHGQPASTMETADVPDGCRTRFGRQSRRPPRLGY